MTIRIMYHDGVYDMISAFTLDQFIRDEKVKKFYRYSEEKWIEVADGPLRNQVPDLQHYGGAERRMSEIIASQLV
ncbi:MAG TPA: hypothetical protein VK448_10935 [Dissulfurispiraceae bacterium]|nr:hypothetical protein [Dissulfurispiraceae bacterium]